MQAATILLRTVCRYESLVPALRGQPPPRHEQLMRGAVGGLGCLASWVLRHPFADPFSLRVVSVMRHTCVMRLLSLVIGHLVRVASLVVHRIVRGLIACLIGDWSLSSARVAHGGVGSGLSSGTCRIHVIIQLRSPFRSLRGGCVWGYSGSAACYWIHVVIQRIWRRVPMLLSVCACLPPSPRCSAPLATRGGCVCAGGG